MEERARERWREGGIIMVGDCQGEREKQGEGKKEDSKSPAHSGKTIQLVSEGTHSTQRERERGKEVKREREELPSSGIT